MRKFAKEHKWTIVILAVVLIALSAWFITKNVVNHTIHVVRRGTFEKFIETKGEIKGKNAVTIALPEIFKDRELQIWDIKIRDMVPEGILVKAGDWVALLDQQNINQQLQNNREQLDNRLAQFNDAKIDSALTLSQIRQRIRELEFDLKYNAIELDQARFESPAYQRRIKTAYNQKIRQIDAAKRDLELRKMDMATRVGRDETRLKQLQNIDSKLKQALVETRITAPQPGMVVYARVRGNRKVKIGDEVGAWRPEIATLPDLSVLISETYVEEIDIAKISVGDSVIITVDALPGKQYKGNILKIANVGQEMSGYDAKVFSVITQLVQTDKKLLPGMTSSNRIILERIPNQLMIPRNCMFTEDNKAFVYQKKGGTIYKKIVTPGPENDEMIVISQGLSEKDRILLQPPANAGKIALSEN